MLSDNNTSRYTKRSTKRKMRRIYAKIFRFLFWISFLGVFAGAFTAAALYFYLSDDLPKISTLADYRPPIITTVYSDDNRKIAEFFKERRIIIPLSKMPELLKKAFIAAEDARFYKHKGIDIASIIRAFFKNIEAGEIVQGGSTITQQVAKSFFLSPKKSYLRKMKEAILAYRIDKTFSKEEILFLYLNQIYLGHGAYGVQAAAENYFGKSAEQLDLAECAMLAGLPQAPSRYSPFKHPERAKQRQIYVLNRMVQERFITRQQATEAIHKKLDIKPRRNWYIEEVPFYTEHVRRYVEEKYGKDALYKEGLKIYTAVNIEMQKIAREEINKGLLNLDKRQGYRGPLDHLAPEAIESYSKKLQQALENDPPQPGNIIKGVVIAVDDTSKTVTVRLGNMQGIIELKDMRWARKPDPEVAYYEGRLRVPSEALEVGDVILVRLKGKKKDSDLWELALEQTPKAQAALLCMESETGFVKVMVGGRDFKETQFNRAIQSRRQPGSAFKPIIYAAAIDKGYTPATVIIDSPIITKDLERDFTWKPKNYEEKFHGPTLLRKALAKSRNVVTIKILKDIGVEYAIEYARKLGITSNISRNLSIALGSSGVSLLEIVRAYSVFNHLGELIEPIFIRKIVDRDGNVLEEMEQKKKRVIDRSTAYIMTSLLESVVKEGTGWRVRALKRPVAGKTGTTNNLFDAWFVGYTPEYTTGVWVGFDEGGSLGKGETGSRAASPIWLGFMKRILEGKPVKLFQVPEEVVFAKIDAETGLLPIRESKKVLFECFKEGTVPTRHTQKPDAISEKAEFFKSIM
ncbi:MAG: PBP1A family penicillin-binding protein [Deltaproteobacteria bacterium]|nr:PBP1A family penicillin-binding protein [Deltaproteobacteria bacterium]MBW2150117.1 PBP1A family penicillin-binding protein [Deltaproteobacteria bacterium]